LCVNEGGGRGAVEMNAVILELVTARLQKNGNCYEKKGSLAGGKGA